MRNLVAVVGRDGGDLIGGDLEVGDRTRGAFVGGEAFVRGEFLEWGEAFEEGEKDLLSWGEVLSD